MQITVDLYQTTEKNCFKGYNICCIERYFIGFYTLFFEIEEL